MTQIEKELSMGIKNNGLTLGGLIDALEKMDPSSRVYFDFCGVVPGHVNSYRGYYEDIALSWTAEPGEYPIVETLLKTLKAAVGTVFHGYKGGDFRMTRDSDLWVANYGRTSDTFITAVSDSNYGVTLHTEYEP